MDLIPQVVVVIIILVWNVVLTFYIVNQRRKVQKITRNGKMQSLFDVVSDVLKVENNLQKTVSEVDKKVEGLIFDSQFYIQKIGLVRFNPFNDTGGDQSFILALTDEKDSGVVISGLHTRNGTRWYAKKVENGVGVEHELSSDEVRAIKTATKRIRR